MQNGRFWV